MAGIVEAAKALCAIAQCDINGCTIVYVQCPGPAIVPTTGGAALLVAGVLVAAAGAWLVTRRA